MGWKLALGMGLLLISNVYAQDKKQEEGTRVTTQRLGDVVKVLERSTPAEVVSLNQATVSAQIPASVNSIKVKVGDFVKKGQVLAQLDCRDFKANLAQVDANIAALDAKISAAKTRVTSSRARAQTAESQAQAAQARVAAAQTGVNSTQTRITAADSRCTLARKQFQRQQQLFNQRLISNDAFDQARNQLETANADCRAARTEMDTTDANIVAAQADQQAAQAAALASQADVDAAKADIASLRADLLAAKAGRDPVLLSIERCQIKAPFAGQVTQRLLQMGQYIAAGSPSFELLDTKQLETSSQLTQQELKSLKQAKQVFFQTGKNRLEVKQRSVLAQVTGVARTQEVRLRFKKRHKLPAGQQGRLVWQSALPSLSARWLSKRNGKFGVLVAQDKQAQFVLVEGAKEGQPFSIDLASDTLLIDQNRLRVKAGDALKLVKE